MRFSEIFCEVCYDLSRSTIVPVSLMSNIQFLKEDRHRVTSDGMGYVASNGVNCCERQFERKVEGRVMSYINFIFQHVA
jgi:hypothetical protein